MKGNNKQKCISVRGSACLLASWCGRIVAPLVLASVTQVVQGSVEFLCFQHSVLRSAVVPAVGCPAMWVAGAAESVEAQQLPSPPPRRMDVRCKFGPGVDARWRQQWLQQGRNVDHFPRGQCQEFIEDAEGYDSHE